MNKSELRVLMTLLLILSGMSQIMALSGSWRGELDMGSIKLPLIFNLKGNDSGIITEATLDSPQQNATGIPMEIQFCSSDSISLSCNSIGASFSGRVKDGTITGTFTQHIYKIPLTLSPEKPLSERRPQTPLPPFPYFEKDTVFTSADGTMLAGTLTLPEPSSVGNTPVVVMVTGSGPQNRDEEIFEHRPFAVIADYLARKGIASFRYDDRGIAGSKGDFSKATINTFKDDAESALNFVKSFPEFGKAGILGHSEGGTLATLIASESNPDFIISLAGMVVPAKETLTAQNLHSLEKLTQPGLSDNQKEDTVRLIEILFNTIISQHKEGVSEPIDIDRICKENNLDIPLFVLLSIKRNNAARTDYFDSLVSLDPTDALKKINCPVLAINGTKDTQVDAGSNLSAFNNYVRNAQIHYMEGLNHLLQHADTGEISEYQEIAETISPEVLTIISNFITGI